MFIFASCVGSAARNKRTWNISHSCATYEFVHTGQHHQELKSLLTWMWRPIRSMAQWKRKTRKLVKITRESPVQFFFNVWSSGHWNRPSDEAHGFNVSLFRFWRNLMSCYTPPAEQSRVKMVKWMLPHTWNSFHWNARMAPFRSPSPWRIWRLLLVILVAWLMGWSGNGFWRIDKSARLQRLQRLQRYNGYMSVLIIIPVFREFRWTWWILMQ